MGGQMIAGKGGWALGKSGGQPDGGEEAGRGESLPDSCLGEGQWGVNPWEGLMVAELLWEALSPGRPGELRETLSLHWLFFRCLV